MIMLHAGNNLAGTDQAAPDQTSHILCFSRVSSRGAAHTQRLAPSEYWFVPRINYSQLTPLRCYYYVMLRHFA